MAIDDAFTAARLNLPIQRWICQYNAWLAGTMYAVNAYDMWSTLEALHADAFNHNCIPLQLWPKMCMFTWWQVWTMAVQKAALLNLYSNRAPLMIAAMHCLFCFKHCQSNIPGSVMQPKNSNIYAPTTSVCLVKTVSGLASWTHSCLCFCRPAV